MVGRIAKVMHTLLVVSHVVHYRWRGGLWGYGPYVRELEIWADLFPHVTVAAPCREEPPPGDCLRVDRDNVSVAPIRETGGETLASKFSQAVLVPRLVWQLSRAMLAADAIHVRCPGNLGLLGVMLAPLFSSNLVSKYAGQWNGYPGEAWSFRLQRAVLSSRWWRGPVTVYGTWPKQPPQVVPFFTSMMTTGHIERAQRSARGKKLAGPLRVLYVGRLTSAKNVDVLISAIGAFVSKSIPIECTIIGDGPERTALEMQTRSLRLADNVRFLGGMPFEQVFDYYEQADTLVLASQTEGWPKAILEGMTFGLVCIGSDRGLVPTMLAEGRGYIVPPGDVEALTESLRRIATRPAEFQEMSQRATRWAQQYSLDKLRRALIELLNQRWNVFLPIREEPATTIAAIEP